MIWILQQINMAGTFLRLKINFPGHCCPKQCSLFVRNALRMLECSSWSQSTPSSSCSELGVQDGS